MKRLVSSCLLALALCLAASAAPARDLVVFAAASLKNVLDDIAVAFETSHGTPLALSYAGSAALARQIQHGAPADLYISANTLWMDLLRDQALIRPGTRTVVAGNRLVLIGTQPEQLDLTLSALETALGPDGRLAMGHVQAVPAGIYGKAALEALDVWTPLSPRAVQTDNVRAALRLVTLGEARLGVVYATDAQADENVHVRAVFPQEVHPPIQYPAALTTESTHPDAPDLLRFLQSDQGAGIFAAHGFLPGPAP